MPPSWLPPSRTRTTARSRRSSSGAAVARHVRRRRAATPSRAVLPRRHDHPGRGAGLGCRHSHGLDIVWSARHGATSTLPDLPKAVVEFAPTTDSGRGRASSPRPARLSGEGRTGQRRRDQSSEARSERDALIRLMLLRAVLCLGAALLIGSGAAVTLLSSGVLSAVIYVALTAVMGCLVALRGASGSKVLRLDRMLPRARTTRPAHSASPASPAVRR